jgi:hypothetical protein
MNQRAGVSTEPRAIQDSKLSSCDAAADRIAVALGSVLVIAGTPLEVAVKDAGRPSGNVTAHARVVCHRLPALPVPGPTCEDAFPGQDQAALLTGA